jgi:CDP-paratose 2-epimerase
VTGGAGFVGANLCLGLRGRHPAWKVVAFDNLKRRGSELNLGRLREADVEFVHGDVRSPEDLATLGDADAIVDCSAEPSVLAGVGGSPDYVVQTNLVGAYNCLELARTARAQVVFVSTSRVYPIATLEAAAYEETDTRYEWLDDQASIGLSSRGVAETLPLDGARTLYGASKLAAELLVTEYANSYGLSTVINRCGVIAGPWQMGKVDQGVFTYWLLWHYLRRDLRYIGYGGSGKQVRDVLHVADFVELIDRQLIAPEHWAGAVVNVGGGRANSLSLLELTTLCREVTGNTVAVSAAEESRPGDLRIYLSDCARLNEMTDWRPSQDARALLSDTLDWIVANEDSVVAALT